MPSELNDNNYSYKFTNDVPKIAIITSRYHNEISYELDKQVINVMNSSGIAYDVFEVSGVLELPIALKLAINSSRYDGYVILGSITIDANNSLSKTIYAETLRGIGDISNQGYPTGKAIITAQSEIELKEISLKSDYGSAAAHAVLKLIKLSRKLTGDINNIGFKPASKRNQTVDEAEETL